MGWETIYRRKVTDLDTALATIRSNNRIYIGGGAGVPVQLSQGLVRRADELENVEVTHILTFADAPYVAPEYAKSFRVNALFIGANVRTAVQDGRADFTPVFLSEIPSLFREDGPLPLDVALISLSPPDEHGFCSFGVEIGTTKPAAEAARIILAEINPQMPRTHGDSFIHVSQLTHIIEVDYPLPETPQGKASDVQLQIGRQIAEMIDEVLQPQGVAVVVEGSHMCSMMRGVKKEHPRMMTSYMLGKYREDKDLRREFMDQLRK